MWALASSLRQAPRSFSTHVEKDRRACRRDEAMWASGPIRVTLRVFMDDTKHKYLMKHYYSAKPSAEIH
jgi:hypothetical protein